MAVQKKKVPLRRGLVCGENRAAPYTGLPGAGEALFLRQADGFLYALPLGLTGVEKGLVGFGLMHELGFLLRGVGGPGIDSFHNDPP